MPEPDWRAAARGWVANYVMGAVGDKEEAYKTLLPHIEAAYQRGLMAGRSQVGYREKKLAGPRLSKRQLDVARLAAQGLTNLEIADRLHMSMETVKTHLREASKKTGARSRTHLSALLAAHGLVSPGREETCTAAAAGPTRASTTEAGDEG